MSDKPWVYLVDDDELVLESLSHSFGSAGFIVRYYSEGKVFLEDKLHEENACVILDLSMPNRCGLEVLREIKDKCPLLPVLMYSGKADVLSAVKAMEVGAVTLIQKPVTAEILIAKALDAIAENRHQLEQNRKGREAERRMSQLSARERDVALLVADGYSASSIADKLFISSRTVEAHKSNIFQKLDVKSVAALTRLVLTAQSGTSGKSG